MDCQPLLLRIGRRPRASGAGRQVRSHSHGLFGQIADSLKDVSVKVALHNEAAARQMMERTFMTRNPFDILYSNVGDDE
jgi:hypothetical protein